MRNGKSGKGTWSPMSVGLSWVLTALFCVALLAGSATVFADSDGAFAARPGRPIPLIALPGVNTYRVDAPEEFLKMDRSARGAATITINYLPAGPGQETDRCTAWPEEARKSFAYAAKIWESLIGSTVPITIDACWATNLPKLTLGWSVTNNYFKNFTGSPQPVKDTWYPATLANKLHGSAIDPSKSDIYIAYNTAWPWYYGTDGKCPTDRLDLVSVILHEIAHGLGFAGAMQVEGNQGGYSVNEIPQPEIYDAFVENGAKQRLINTSIFPNPSAQLKTELTGGDLYFNGVKAREANGGTAPKIYAPPKWAEGTSYCHLDYDTFVNTPNVLMTYGLTKGQVAHAPGPVALGLLQDLGWTASTVVTYKLTLAKSGAGTGTVKSAPVGIDCGDTCSNSFDAGQVVTLTATAGSGSRFAGWSGKLCAGTGSCRIVMDSAKSETATFDPCTYTISPKTKALPGPAAGGATVSFTASSVGCPAPEVTIESEDEKWFSFTKPVYNAKTGKGSVTFWAKANSQSSVTRPGSANIGDETFTLTQPGVVCALALKPDVSALIPKKGITDKFMIDTNVGDCAWTVAVDKSSPWVTQVVPSSGQGDGGAVYVVAQNGGKTVRYGKINVGYMANGQAMTKVFTVRQSNK